MEVKVRLTKIVAEDNPEILAEGTGKKEEDYLEYIDTSGDTHRITYKEKEIWLEKDGEFSSQTILKEGEVGTSRVHSPYGDMEFTTKLINQTKENNRWHIHYQVLSNEDIVNEQELIFEIEEN